MARKYKRGKQIKSVGEFEQSKAHTFCVLYGDKEKTTDRGFLIAWQYHYLYWAIKAGRIFEAELRDDIEPKHTPGFVGVRRNDKNAKENRTALQCQSNL